MGNEERAELGRRLRSTDDAVREQAQEDVVAIYAEELAALLQRRLGMPVRQRAGISEVAQKVWNSFFKRVEQTPEDWDVIGLLFRIAACKVADQAAREQAQRRDVRREAGGDQDVHADANGKGPVRGQEKPTRNYHRQLQPESDPDSAFLRRGPYEHDSFFEEDVLKMLLYGADQSHALVFQELLERLDQQDKSNLDLKTIVLRQLAGHSTTEIAQELDCTPRNIQHRMKRIREILQDEE